MRTSSRDPVDIWIVAKSINDSSKLAGIFAEEVIYHPPLIGKIFTGRKAVQGQVATFMKLLSNQDFSYLSEVIGSNEAALEFVFFIEGIEINGIEFLRWNSEGLITEFKVFLRPNDAVSETAKLLAERILPMKERRR